MSEVLAQLEKKGGGGDYADSYIVTSYAEASANHAANCYLPAEYIVPKFTQAKYTLLGGSNLRSAQIRADDVNGTALSTLTLSTSWQDIPSRFYQADVYDVGLVNNARAYDAVRIRFDFR